MSTGQPVTEARKAWRELAAGTWWMQVGDMSSLATARSPWLRTSSIRRRADRTPRLDSVGLLADALGPGERTTLLAAARPEADGTPLTGRAGVAEAVIMEGEARHE